MTGSTETKIAFLTTLINRGHNFFGLYSTLKPLLEQGHQFLVADYGSTDIDLGSLDRISRVIRLALPFRKGVALNLLARAVDTRTHPILAFLDADMVVPENFDVTILENTGPGQCYFPVCFSFNREAAELFPNWKAIRSQPLEVLTRREYGWWRWTGYGNCAFYHEDFHKLGGWNETFTRWGQEDVELWKRASHASWLKTVRKECPGFFHQWHPSDLGSRNYYWKKNSAD